MARTDAIMLGAGIVGTSIALHLAKRGLSVALIDRAGVGEQTLYLPKITSGCIGDAAQPSSEWRQWRQIVGRLDARGHLSVMPSACALDCNTSPKRKEFAAGAPRRRSTFDPGTRGAMCRLSVPHSHFATAIQARSTGREYPWP